MTRGRFVEVGSGTRRRRVDRGGPQACPRGVLDAGGSDDVVAEQNNRFRTSLGIGPAVPGRIVVTAGADAKARVITAVRAVPVFPADSDPFGLHDFGAFEGQDGGRAARLRWKLDLCDLACHFGSGAPTLVRLTDPVNAATKIAARTRITVGAGALSRKKLR